MEKGRLSVSTTARGTVIRSRFVLIDATKIITSHDALTFEPNKNYPAKLQPRDRSRLTSEQQIEGISRNLRPELLSDAQSMTDGSPIIGPDFVVESGNARAMSIQRAYLRGGAPAKRYRQFVIGNLEEFGLKPTYIPPFPILVRIRQTRIDRYRFVVEANETSVASMSDAEQARIDANRMTPALLSLFHSVEDYRNPAHGGDLLMACNRDFVTEFFNTVISPTERGRYVDSTGLISQQGLKRIRNAILAKAFCDTAEGFWVIERIAESLDNNVRVISSALILKAARFTELKAAIESGHRYPLDISGELVKALRTFSDLKAKDTTIEDYLSQGNMLGEGPDRLQGLLLRSLATAKDKRQHLEEILENYIRLVHLFGDPHQLHLTSRPEPTKLDLFEQAFDQFQRDQATLDPATPRKGSRNSVGRAA